MNDIVLYEQRGHIAVITLNRPESLNSFTTELGQGLLTAIKRAAQDESVRAVVLTGSGRAFSAGAELKGALVTPQESISQLEDTYNPCVRAISALPKSVIAAVNGFATDVGASVALSCDMVILGERAFLQVPYARIGLVPDGGMTWQLARRLGPQRAFEIAMSGERMPATTCVALGLANREVPDAELMTEACATADRLAECAPMAVAGTKRLVRRALDGGIEAAFRDEALEQARCVGSDDFQEGVEAFIEKRTARFVGR